jgi:23S rRNA (uracil1939-C5)-methyltransferase
VRLTIEKMIYGGDGLARLPADEHGRGKAVFVPFVLPSEEIEATITGEKPGFVRARAESILQKSSERIDPGCPHFSQCGGCHYQHTSYEHQLSIKAGILLETLRRTARIEPSGDVIIHPSPPWGYRNRSRFQLRTGPDFAAGYYRAGSHDLLPVQECPISSPLVNRGLAAIWQTGPQQQGVSDVVEVELFANSDDKTMLAEFICREGFNTHEVLGRWAADLQAALPEVIGVSASVPARAGQVSGERRWPISGSQHLVYETKRAKYRVSAGAFFQANRHMIEQLVDIVCSDEPADHVLDLYAGVGLFSTVLARDARHVVSVESSQPAATDLAYNLPPSGKAVCATTEKYLSADKPKGGFRKDQLNLVVVDPPRSGMGDRVARSVAALGAARLAYVSCDPATLARDLVPLLAAGYRVDKIHLIDMFPQTYHLESVVKLSRG